MLQRLDHPLLVPLLGISLSHFTPGFGLVTPWMQNALNHIKDNDDVNIDRLVRFLLSNGSASSKTFVPSYLKSHGALHTSTRRMWFTVIFAGYAL